MTKALLLLSGGIDSPVAGRLLQDQGVELEAVHFSLAPFTDDAAEDKSAELGKMLGLKRMFVVPAGPIFGELTKACDPRLYFVLSKRYMLRVSDELAPRLGCVALATGENIGQVSSQTLSNLSAITRASAMPVLRPLLTWDKHDTIRFAQAIGTFETSKGPEVCDVLGPEHPALACRPERVEEEERKLDYAKLVERGLLGLRERALT